MREAEIEMREAGQFHSLSFRVFALRGSQPGKKKKLTRWRVETRTLEPTVRGRERLALGRNSSERSGAEGSEGRKERGTECGSFVSPHPIDLHLVLA